MAKEFYNNLINYVSASDTSNANNLLMREVGKSLVKNKSNFIELLTSSGVPASESMSDMELVDSFVNALPNNKSLMIGTAYMINNDNKFVSADGNEQISDKGVKVCYNVMYDYFSGEEEEYSNVPGVAEAIAGAVQGVATLGTKIAEGQQKKKYGAMDALSKQKEAKQQMVQSILAERRAKIEESTKQKETKSKTTKIILIVAGSIVALGIIGFVIYKIKKGKQ
jgi:F0F1-type ATP synthase membrane subunit c/vacuolar-type H+-ATPase subunit K